MKSDNPTLHKAGPLAQGLTRREALGRLSAGALLSLGLWPGCAHLASVNTASFQFLAVNDTHYMSPQCGEWLEGVVRQMRAHQDAEFCLIAGDLTEHGKKDHLGAVREIFSGLKRPVHVVIGNHDYESAESRAAYEAVFPGRLNYMFRHRGWQFVGLDSSEGQKYQGTQVQLATLRWVDRQLPRLSRTQPTVVFTHFPLGAGVTYRPLNADALLERFRPLNLRAAFSGHFHGRTERYVGSGVATTNRCCALKRNNHDGTREKGYFLCTAANGQVTRQFVETPMPSDSPAQSS